MNIRSSQDARCVVDQDYGAKPQSKTRPLAGVSRRRPGGECRCFLVFKKPCQTTFRGQIGMGGGICSIARNSSPARFAPLKNNLTQRPTDVKTKNPRKSSRTCGGFVIALGAIRTRDPRFRKPVLYPLSYEGQWPDRVDRVAGNAVRAILSKLCAGVSPNAPNCSGRRDSSFDQQGGSERTLLMFGADKDPLAKNQGQLHPHRSGIATF